MKSMLLRITVWILLTSQGIPVPQTTGALRAMVNDTSGVWLPGVMVELSLNGVVRQRGLTDEKGEVVFLQLAPGQYGVTSALPGFTTAVVLVIVTEGVTPVSIELKALRQCDLRSMRECSTLQSQHHRTQNRT